MSLTGTAKHPQAPSTPQSHGVPRIRFHSWGQDNLHFQQVTGWPGDHTWKTTAPRDQGEEGGLDEVLRANSLLATNSI